MAQSRIETYFAQYQSRASQTVQLYTLIDGLLYAHAEQAHPLERSNGAVALFDGTPDASLAHSGPWLIDWDRATPSLRDCLHELAAGPTGVSWLISADMLESLAQVLRERLDIRMPDGRLAWLRFQDARIMPDIAAVLSPSQREKFFAPVTEWLTQVNGTLTRIHSYAA